MQRTTILRRSKTFEVRTLSSSIYWSRSKEKPAYLFSNPKQRDKFPNNRAPRSALSRTWIRCHFTSAIFGRFALGQTTKIARISWTNFSEAKSTQLTIKLESSWTPLFTFAVLSLNVPVAKFLLQQEDINLHLQNREGLTAKDIVSQTTPRMQRDLLQAFEIAERLDRVNNPSPNILRENLLSKKKMTDKRPDNLNT